MLASFVEYHMYSVHVPRVARVVSVHIMCVISYCALPKRLAISESIIPTWPWLTLFSVVDSGLRVESLFTGAGKYIVCTYKYIDRAGQKVSNHRKEI